MFDVVYVSYNSEKWIKRCFDSWNNLKYNLKKINVFVVDNASSDNSLAELENVKKLMGFKFGSFNVLDQTNNWGFGKANNIGFRCGSAETVCFLNIDTELFEDTFIELERELNGSNEKIGIWEFRQFPYEHPKMYDPLTGYTDWSSGASFAVKRSVYEEVGGFDEKIFLYAEDVDLSWRVRSLGYNIKYAPKICITHHSYNEAEEVKPNQYIYSVVNNLMLRHRFGTIKEIIVGYLHFCSVICHKEVFEGGRKRIIKEYLKCVNNIGHFKANNKYKNKVGNFIGWDYSSNRDGAFYINKKSIEKPLVSVVVRTCGRPSVLRETLLSLRNQTYSNIEIVVVEDGKAISDKLIAEEFSDLNIIYKSTGEKVGRSKTGNIAMSMSSGKYLNFLDDDDLFFADHVETLVAGIEDSECRAIYSTGFETPINVISREPYEYKVFGYNKVHTQPYDRILLCHHNYIPIQCIMFEKSLFEECGGLDENVDALEDWDMWVRYSLSTDFAFAHKTTSIYRVPYDEKISRERQKCLDEALLVMRNKHKTYQQKVSVYDISQMCEKSYLQ